MLWSILFKTYTTAALLYLAVTLGYVAWRFWLRKKESRAGGDER